jgi:oxygen-independent coproporphyrinogen III oxidase
MMKQETLAMAEARVPRYTSYPTAPHFKPQIDGARVAGWLGQIDARKPVSLYLHVPFCGKLCWYCGCNTSIASKYDTVGRFVDTLLAEIDTVGAATGQRLRAGHVHFGGGTPNALSPADFARVAAHLRAAFEIGCDVPFEIEIDPRTLDAAMAKALVEAGVTRVNFGIQDFDPHVQAAINRIQPVELVAEKIGLLRQAGLEEFGVDLLYGLPYQTEASIARTVGEVAQLGAARVSLFGYAHVPWMKPHQKLLEPHGLPGTSERLQLAAAAHAALAAAEYARVGIDHFAKADDALAVAARDGRLRRNFQGYTTDTADTLIAFGPSAISAFAQGFAQNHTRLDEWRTAVQEGRLPVARGCATNQDDHVRADAIERLMCDFALDLDTLAQTHRLAAHPLDYFARSLAQIDRLAAEGLCVRDGVKIAIPATAINFARVVASAFDAYLAASDAKYSVAV